MEYLKCTRCKSGWEISDGESFCGWCGTPLLGFNIEIIDSPIIYIDGLVQDGEGFQIHLEVINQGIKPILLEKPIIRRV